MTVFRAYIVAKTALQTDIDMNIDTVVIFEYNATDSSYFTIQIVSCFTGMAITVICVLLISIFLTVGIHTSSRF